MVIGTCSGSVTLTELTVHKCDGERKETVSVSGSFGVQYSAYQRQVGTGHGQASWGLQ